MAAPDLPSPAPVRADVLEPGDWDDRRRHDDRRSGRDSQRSPGLTRRPVAGVARPEERLRRMLRLRVMRVLLALLGVLVVPACGTDGSSASPPVAAVVASPAVQTTRDVDFSTHCGVENALVDGRWWHVVDPLYGHGGPGTGPPEGWGDPTQSGDLRVDGELAVFDGPDQLVTLVPAETNNPVRVCR